MKKDTSYACLRLALPVRININLILPSCSGLMVKAYTRCVVDAAGVLFFLLVNLRLVAERRWCLRKRGDEQEFAHLLRHDKRSI